MTQTKAKRKPGRPKKKAAAEHIVEVKMEERGDVIGTAIEDSAPEDKPKPVYTFPTKSRCPKCKDTNTHAVSTQGSRQYRVCSSRSKTASPLIICRHRYSVDGEEI